MNEDKIEENDISGNSESKPINLLCEYMTEALGIDVLLPRFSWNTDLVERGQFQKAYQILVASIVENLDKDYGDMWDSGRIESNQSVNVIYSGKKLKSEQICYWKVRIWDKDEKATSYSNISKFEVSLLRPEDWQAEWIGSDDKEANGVAPLFRKEFTLKKNIKRARVYISGLGYYELRINGKKVGDNILDPGWTEYSKRILYITYAVEDYLKEGSNVIGVILGNGQFNLSLDHIGMFKKSMREDKAYGIYGPPRMILQMSIEFEDGSKTNILSQHSSGWSVANGPIIENSIFNGETYDARLEKKGWDTQDYTMDPKEWKPPVKKKEPGGILKSQLMEPIKVVEEIKSLQLTNPKSGIYVFDLGQNFAGWTRLKVSGQRGTKVSMKFAEVIYDDGTVNQENLRTARAMDTYILKGDQEEVYEPRFTYHGFRYVQIEGFPGEPKLDSIVGKVVRSSVEQIGEFHCGNDLLNKIYNMIYWSEASNLHSVPTDCCQRDERLGWLDDMTIRAEGAMYIFNMSRFYAKFLNDIEDAIDLETGAIADTAPYRYGKRPADPVSSTFIIIPWLLYLHYSDKRVLEQHYKSMKGWIDFLTSVSEEYIIPYSYYGDWAQPIKESVAGSIGDGAVSATTPGEFMSTGYYYLNAIIMHNVARVLEKNSDESKYSSLADKIKIAFNNKFLNNNTNQYSTGSQACNAFSLYLGLVPDKNKQGVIDNLIKNIEEKHKWHISTGIHTTKYLIDALTDLGYVDIIYKIATQTTYPSWGFQIENGATASWERWELMTGSEMNSHNQGFGALINTWFFKGLAGINAEWNNSAANKFIIKPHVVKDLGYVNTSLKTIRGLVASNWKIEDNSLTLDVIVPFNSMAKVFIPKLHNIFGEKITILENKSILWKEGKYIQDIEGIFKSKEEEDFIVLDVGSGSYEFEVKIS